jgi:hypothetical protein
MVRMLRRKGQLIRVARKAPVQAVDSVETPITIDHVGGRSPISPVISGTEHSMAPHGSVSARLSEPEGRELACPTS